MEGGGGFEVEYGKAAAGGREQTEGTGWRDWGEWGESSEWICYTGYIYLARGYIEGLSIILRLNRMGWLVE